MWPFGLFLPLKVSETGPVTFQRYLQGQPLHLAFPSSPSQLRRGPVSVAPVTMGSVAFSADPEPTPSLVLARLVPSFSVFQQSLRPVPTPCVM